MEEIKGKLKEFTEKEILSNEQKRKFIYYGMMATANIMGSMIEQPQEPQQGEEV